MTQELKQDILVLAGLIAQIAEAEADLGVPTETAEYALDQALPIVVAIAGEDSDEVALMNEARSLIHTALEELVY